MSRKTAFIAILTATGLAGCFAEPDATPAPADLTPRVDVPTSEVVKSDEPRAPAPPESAPPASPRLEPLASSPERERIESYFANLGGSELYIQIDKPLYKPGETIWFRSFNLKRRDLRGAGATWIDFELISPKGISVIKKRVKTENGLNHNDFELAPSVAGGEYTIRARSSDGATSERTLIINSYEAPRIKKKLEFMRKAYGAGDKVVASIEIKRPTGAPLADHPIQPRAIVDGTPIVIPSTRTDREGNANITLQLPARIQRPDALLTVAIEDGGITESISKRIPVVLKTIELSFFPEGGEMVQGLASRVYFEAKNASGKPADVEGKIVDDQGNAVARFETYDRGLGRLDFTPSTARQYHAEVTKPIGIRERYPLPLAAKHGCVMRSYDDLDGQLDALRVRIVCDEEQTVTVLATLRDVPLDSARVKAGTEGAVVHLDPEPEYAARRGVARVTVFDETYQPLAERLVFRKRRSALQVAVTPDRDRYAPRDQVELLVETRSSNGEPVSANLALSVVDDTVVSFADDKTHHLTSSLLLGSELPGKIEEPRFFLDLTEKKSALALELLMGTRGYRRFEWRAILSPPRPRSSARLEAEAIDEEELGGVLPREGLRRMQPQGQLEKLRAAPVDRLREERRARPAPAPEPRAEPMPDAKPAAQPLDDELMLDAADALGMPARENKAMAEVEMEPPPAFDVDKDFQDAERFKKKRAIQPTYAKVRVFPSPTYDQPFDGVRTDFRETVHWAPQVKTDAQGQARVRFYLSDAVTSFRAFAEGHGGNHIGREETTFESSLPFSLNVKIPTELSAGDVVQLPVTLSNERSERVAVALDARFGQLLVLDDEELPSLDTLAPKQRASLFYPLRVTGSQGESMVKIAAQASGLQDEIARSVAVVPRGFPRVLAEGGSVGKRSETRLDLSAALPGSIEAQVTVYPSVTATLVSGLEGMLRQPSGCFEQTSSSNYPNVLVMDYLRSSGQGDPALLARAGDLIDDGYKRLVGFETEERGYEWFGSTPAHEALTAYGVLEFSDMQRVYGGVDKAMLKRTVGYLERRRDGKGGYQRDAKALDSFGRASPEVTDAYITYAVTEAGYGERFRKEVEKLATESESSNDPYVLALAANTLMTIEDPRGPTIVKKLLTMQKDDGSFQGTTHSITRSTGQNLAVETTGLSVLAMLKSSGNLPRAARAVKWLGQQRQYGAFGATQATVMALRAITAFGKAAQSASGSGRVTLIVNGTEIGSQSYESGQTEGLVFNGFQEQLVAGPNTIELKHQSQGQGELPFEVASTFYVKQGRDHQNAKLRIDSRLEKSSLEMGDTVRLNAVVENLADEGRPMTVARIGLPAGLNPLSWQLKELKEKKRVDFYETRNREVVLYFRQLKPSERREVTLELSADIPGRFVSPASRAYLYYTDDQKVWAKPTTVTIAP